MRFLILFASIGVLMTSSRGAELGDVLCYSDLMDLCRTEFQNKIITGNDNVVCEECERIVGCRTIAAQQCNMSREQSILDSNQSWRDMCKIGTRLHQITHPNLDCILNVRSSDECKTKEQLKKNVYRTDQEERIMQKLIFCKSLKWNDRCLDKAIGKRCGLEAAEAHRELYTLGTMRVDTVICDAIFGADSTLNKS